MIMRRDAFYTGIIFLICFLFQIHDLAALQLDSIKRTENPKKVTIIGTGYVGIVSGSGLAEIGHHVTCVDINREKIAKLNQRIMPIYEPDIREFIDQNVTDGRLTFSSDIDEAMRNADIIIIAVGTPMDNNGDADLSALMNVIQVISKNINGYKIICTKSTVPIGTNKKIKQLLNDMCGENASFDVVSNPEFLREGSAYQDFFYSNPIVLGSDSEKALSIMEELYKPLIENGTTLIKADTTSAETIKYAWNSYSFIKVSFVNQLSEFCNAVNANIGTVVQGISFSEKLLPIKVVKPGPGIGGSCLPKDTSAFVTMAKKCGIDMSIVVAARQANENHKVKIIKDFYSMFNDSVRGKKIAVLGLSFKANTDDIRYSPAIDILKTLIANGADVYAYDPQAMANMKVLVPQVIYCSSVDEALSGADGLLLLTDWNEFKNLKLDHIAALMKDRIVFDARNMWDPKELEKYQFTFKNLGLNA